MKAKYYIYRNLHKNCFSVRFRGKVIDHITNFVAHDVVFKVNEAGRQRVIKEKSKNVHAFVVASNYDALPTIPTGEQITYNPYQYDSFVFAESKEPIHNAPTICGYANRLWLFEFN